MNQSSTLSPKPTPDARAAEAALLARCVAVAGQPSGSAEDAREANVFRLASMVISSRFPRESVTLMQASNRFFAHWPDEKLDPSNVVREGWIFSLPRLRDMLTRRLNAG